MPSRYIASPARKAAPGTLAPAGGGLYGVRHGSGDKRGRAVDVNASGNGAGEGAPKVPPWVRGARAVARRGKARKRRARRRIRAQKRGR